MQDTITKLEKQHIENYKNAIKETLKNNTRILVEEDIISLIKKPPLDSMDTLKCKFLDLAKKSKIVLDTKCLTQILESYRKDMKRSVKAIEDIRINEFIPKIDEFNDDKDIIKFTKKEFNKLNKKIKKYIKETIESSLEKNIVKNVNKLFTKETDEAIKEKINTDISKYLSKNYKKQILDSIDLKILVKDTTLINSVKEQGERYIFTKLNSHVLND